MKSFLKAENAGDRLEIFERRLGSCERREALDLEALLKL